MHTMLKKGALAATLIAATAMMATPSEARCRNCGAAAAGFVAGAAVGAIAANSYNNNYYGPAYGYGYSDPGYAYYNGPGYDDSYAYEPAPTYRSRGTNYESAKSYYDNQSLMSR